MIGQMLLFCAAALFSFLLTSPVIWVLKLLHLNQSIRQEGPPNHQIKTGTLTMGGIGFILTIIIFTIIFISFEFNLRYLALILLVLGFACIGLTDDLMKVFRHQNQGLTLWQKIIVQTIFAAIFSAFLVMQGHYLINPALYVLLSTFLIVGTANATNLTDGLNGLLAGTATIAFIVFALVAEKLALSDAVTFCVLSAGAIAVFLYFNFPEAKVFMGDIGSLAIGAALAGIAIIMHKELLLAVIGGVFLVEALSVIMQVAGYKLWRRRVFKMAPIHHHFELMGFSEFSIVIGFWVVGIILGIAGVLIG